MKTGVFFGGIASLFCGDTEGQWPLPKMGKLAQNARSPMPVGVLSALWDFGRSLRE